MAMHTELVSIPTDTVPLDGACRPRAGVVVDRFDLWRDGAHALWADGDGIRVRSSRATRGDRPWVGVP